MDIERKAKLTTNKPKARTIEDREKAIVIQSTHRAESIDASISSQAFVRHARELLGVSDTHGLWAEEMADLTKKLGLPPTAYFNPGSHWTLVTALRDQIRIYDPMEGLREVPLNTDRRIYYVKDDQLFLLKKDSFVGFEKIIDDDYELDERTLQTIGALQTDPWNCGPLSVYAATLAHNSKQKA